MKAISLISGGIDSPVATYLMLRKGVEVILLHFYKSDEDIVKIRKIAEKLREYGKIAGFYAVRHSDLFKRDYGRYNCIYCKILMVKTAEILCREKNCHGIIMGDNLGQVASQTLDNMLVISRAVKVPILRPLVGLDKEEIIDIAKRISTYEISIEHQYRCPFLPKNPVTKANPENIDYSKTPEVEFEEIALDA